MGVPGSPSASPSSFWHWSPLCRYLDGVNEGFMGYYGRRMEICCLVCWEFLSLYACCGGIFIWSRASCDWWRVIGWSVVYGDTGDIWSIFQLQSWGWAIDSPLL